MMYLYRRMTPEQRLEVVELRRSRRFPLHKPPHLNLGEGWYLISAATFEHRPHFAVPKELSALEYRLLEAFSTAGVPCAGWVVLPNHYHAFVNAVSPRAVGQAIGPVHGRSARYANRRDDTPGRQVWYKFTDRKVRSERHYWACLHYIIYNPVKHGYVTEMAQWPWSCFHELLRDQGAEWVEDLARRYPLGDFGKVWDE
jgi:putative transposase